ncbi:MAG: putative toxin-antitoxin system toxin component, PIN family [Bacillota bacterium]
MKVVIDTNVLISGLFSSQSPPAKVLNLWLVNKLDVYVSPEIIERIYGRVT